MRYDEARDIIVCQGCRREVATPASALTEAEKSCLAAFARWYTQRTGTRLSPTRDLRDIRG